MNDRLDVKETMQMYRDFTRLYGALMGFLAGKGVQIHPSAMTQIAPLPVWNLNIQKRIGSDQHVTYYHEIRIDDVLFYTLTDTLIDPSEIISE